MNIAMKWTLKAEEESLLKLQPKELEVNQTVLEMASGAIKQKPKASGATSLGERILTCLTMACPGIKCIQLVAPPVCMQFVMYPPLTSSTS